MKEHYDHDNVSGDYTPKGCMAFTALMLVVAVKTFRHSADERTAVIAAAVGVPILLFFIFYPFGYSYFEADDSAVTFVRLFKRKRIEYSEIKSIEVKTEEREQYFRNRKYTHYAEVITFHSAERDFSFAGKIYTAPDAPQTQTENSKFMRLKRFIEEKKAG